MGEPKRWLCDGAEAPEGALELLRAAEPVPEMSAASHAQALLQATVLSSTPVATGGALAFTKITALVVGAAGAGSLGLSTVLGGALDSTRPERPQVELSSPPSRAVATTERLLTPERAAVQVEDLEPVMEREGELEDRGLASIREGHALSSTAKRVHKVERRFVPSRAGDALAIEAAMIRKAKSLLSDNPAGALQVAEEHHRRFPSGQLGGAASLIAIKALYRLGRIEEATRRAEAAITCDPEGIYAQQIRRLLSQGAK